MDNNKFSEEELLALLKEGNEGALRYLYSNYSAALFGVILRIVESKENAEDVLQDTFVKIWKNIPLYDESKGKLYTWFLSIARNTAIDSLRVKNHELKKQNQSIDNSVHSVNLQYNISTQIEHIGLKTIVGKMKPECKEIIDKVYFEGYTQEAAAKELNIPLGTVKTRLRSALRQLRDVFIEEQVAK